MLPNAFKCTPITKILPNNTTKPYLPYHPELSSHMFTHSLKCIKQNASKCYQMIPNAHESFRACMIPCEISSTHDTKYAQTPPEYIQIPPNATKYSQMLPCLYDKIWDFAPKCIQMPPGVPKCYQTLPSAPRCSKVLPCLYDTI